jgi:hypothetical protein
MQYSKQQQVVRVGGGANNYSKKSGIYQETIWSTDGNSSDVLQYIPETKGNDVLNYKKKLNKVKTVM